MANDGSEPGAYRPVYSSDWIHRIESQEHWSFYWNLAKLVEGHVPQHQRILEIGVGSSFLSNYLKSRGWNVVTLDIDPGKRPDLLGNAAEFDFAGLGVSWVLAFEIFEHMPFPVFEATLANIARSRVQGMLFSVPWCERRLLDIGFKLPFLPAWRGGLWLPKRSVTTPAHFWELRRGNGPPGAAVMENHTKGTVPVGYLERTVRETGFTLRRLARVSYIQFYVAERSAGAVAGEELA